MEKYGQYRDKGSGIAPFFPIAPPPSNVLLAPYHFFLFSLRIPLLVFAWVVWLFIIQWTPAGGPLRKANLWCILGLPGVWWIDIRVDGVQRGSLGKGGATRLPGPATIIASSYTSPLDVMYLAAIFDPIFTQSFPATRVVQPLSLEGALAACFSTAPSAPTGGRGAETVELAELVARNPQRVIVVFPESTTSNGRGVLRLSPSLLSAGQKTSIYPVALRYTPADVVTPIPGWLEAVRFVWRLCSRQTHCIRVRVGHPTSLGLQQKQPAATAAGFNTTTTTTDTAAPNKEDPRGRLRQRNSYDTNFFDSLKSDEGDQSIQDSLKPAEKQSLDVVAESLSRLGRAKTLALGVEEKNKFVDAWMGKAKKRR